MTSEQQEAVNPLNKARYLYRHGGGGVHYLILRATKNPTDKDGVYRTALLLTALKTHLLVIGSQSAKILCSHFDSKARYEIYLVEYFSGGSSNHWQLGTFVAHPFYMPINVLGEDRRAYSWLVV